MAAIKKYLFWGVSTVIVLTIGIMWFIATGTLNDDRTKNESSIASQFTDLQNVNSTNDGNHPNQSFQDGMAGMMRKVRADIKTTWEGKYTNQKLAFNWPVGPGQLDQITANYFIPLTPIELKVESDGVINPQDKTDKTEISQIARTKYKDFVPDYLQSLANIVDARWGAEPAKETGGGNFNGGTDPAGGFGGVAGGADSGTGQSTSTKEAIDAHLVIWEESNQKALESRFGWENKVPSTLDILYAQEDLWVLNQWLSIIADMNKSADAAYNAKVTDIIGIDLAKNGSFIGPTGVDLAKEAILSGSKIADSGMSGMGGMGMGGMDMGQGMDVGADAGGGGSQTSSPGAAAGMSTDGGGGSSDTPTGGTGGTAPAAEPANDPGDLRYVDDTYQPLPIAALRSALNITSSSRNIRPELAIAKRYPTRIRLNMDLRYLTQFLAACGNAELSIEVLQVRINAPSGMNKGGDAGGSGLGGDMGMGMGMGESPGDGGEMDMGMGGEMGMGMGMGMGSANVIQAASMPYHVEVEIYGIVYIYNPVNLDALGVETTVNNTNNAAVGGIGAE